MKLYEISGEFLTLRAMLESGEIDQQTFDDTIAIIDCDFETKARNCMMLHREMKAGADAMQAEIDRLSSLKRTADASADRLTDYLKSNMIAIGREKIDLGIFKLTLKKATMVPNPLNLDAIPPEFFRVIPESRALDKVALKKALEVGAVPGAELIEGKRALLIK